MSSYGNYPFQPHLLEQNLLNIFTPTFPVPIPNNSQNTSSSSSYISIGPPFHLFALPQQPQHQQIQLQQQPQHQQVQLQQQQQCHHHHPFQPEHQQQQQQQFAASTSNRTIIGAIGGASNDNNNSVILGIQEPSTASYSYAAAARHGRDYSNSAFGNLFAPATTNGVNGEEERKEHTIQTLFPIAVSRPMKRRASLEVHETISNNNHPDRADWEQEQDLNNNIRGNEVSYSASLIPDESYFRLELFEKKDTIRDQLRTLVQRAREYCIYSECVLDAVYGCFNPSTVRVMFAFCGKLRVNLHTFFSALEIFDRFTTKHNSTVRDMVIRKSYGVDQFNYTREKLRVLVPLRIATCIHIAGKLHCDSITEVVTIPNILSMLKTIGHGHAFSREDVINSEIKIFNALNFRLAWPQPLEIIEVVLAAIDLLVDARMEAYSSCVCLLFFAYQHHHELYDELWDVTYQNHKPAYVGNRRKRNVIGKSLQGARKDFREKTECNIALRCGAIVATSLLFNSKLKEPDSIPHAVYTREIADMLGVSMSGIFDLSICFLRVVQRNESSSPSSASGANPTC